MTDHVKLIVERSVHVVAASPANVQRIRELDGAPVAGADSWRIDYDTEDHLAQILQHLRDADLPFAGGPAGWPPAAIAQHLRDKGKLHGPIKEISWRGPDQEVIQFL